MVSEPIPQRHGPDPGFTGLLAYPMNRSVIATICSMLFTLLTHAQDCCTEAGCLEQARSHALSLAASSAFLPKDRPERIDSAYYILDRARSYDPVNYNRWVKTYAAYIEWCLAGTASELRPLCVLGHLENDSKTRDWMAVQDALNYRKGRVVSPEFRRGLHLQTELGIGGVDLGTAREGAWGSVRTLISLTWGHRKGIPLRATGGTWRLLSGPELFYTRSTVDVALDTRLAHRITDVGPDLASLANLHVFGEFMTTGKRNWLGPGVQGEAHRIGLGLAILGDISQGGFMARLNIVYRFGLKPVVDTNEHYDRP